MTPSHAYRYRESDPGHRAAAVFASRLQALDWADELARARGAVAWVLEVRRDGAWRPVHEVVAPRPPIVRLLTGPRT